MCDYIKQFLKARFQHSGRSADIFQAPCYFTDQIQKIITGSKLL